VKANLRGGGGEACMEAIQKMWAKKEESDKEKEKAKQERFVTALDVDKEALALEKIRADAHLISRELMQNRRELKRSC
jgi:hypothetical protein